MIQFIALAVLVCSVTAASSAHAQAVDPLPVGKADAADFGDYKPAADLDKVRGGDGKVVYQAVTDQVLSASNSGNVVSASTVGSGAISFGQGATSGFNGIGNFVVNTGHNNNLQGAISVNVLITPGK